MPDETEKEILKKIQSTLTEIRAILALTNEDKLAESKRRLLPENSMKLQIYNLCDGTRTTQEISTTLQKQEPSVRSTLTDLRRDGLIRSFEREGRQFHEQIF